MMILRNRSTVPDVGQEEGRVSAVEERRALYRDLVLSAAEGEFARVGYAETKVAAIAVAADLSLATLYKSFSGKEETWNELHTRRMEALVALVERRVTTAGTPLERLLDGIAAVAEYLTGQDAYLELNLRASSGWLTPATSIGVQRSVWASGLDMIAAGVDAARAAGELTYLRTRIATGVIVSALQVWLADWVDAGRDREADVVVDELVAHLRMTLTRPAHESPPEPETDQMNKLREARTD
jgi:AcrR family transcriptional regulator